jgi:hypothetical protein
MRTPSSGFSGKTVFGFENLVMVEGGGNIIVTVKFVLKFPVFEYNRPPGQNRVLGHGSRIEL